MAPLRPPSWYVARWAPRMGLDPKAVMSVIRGEGGDRWGAVGDQGTSFGPVQLHVGGALPAGRGAAWANSPAGLRYALRQMAKSGARGLTGAEAIRAIITRFERPADPQSSIRNAVARYGQQNVPQVGAGRRGQRPARTDAADPGRALAMEILSQLSQRGHVDPQGLLQFAAEWRANEQGGTTIPPVENGGAPRSGNGVVDRILAFAHAQVGQPYVWGGESRKEGGFDCSGLLDAAYRAAGIDLPGRLTSQSILRLGRSVKGKSLRPGDMIVSNGGRHVVMYVGGGKVIAAPRRGEPVQYQPLSRFQGDIVDIRRVL